jgi:hypothetical protein
LCAVANEAFHYWRVDVETMICEVLICANDHGNIWVYLADKGIHSSQFIIEEGKCILQSYFT